ncbi:unnamed protein product, partial [Closterium sp. NIES-65]
MSTKRLFGGTTILFLLALLVPDPTGRTPPFPSASRLLLHTAAACALPFPPRSPPFPPALFLSPLLSSSPPCSPPLPPALLLFPLLSSSSPCSPPHPAALLSFPPSCNQRRGAWVVMPPPNEQMLLSPRSYPSPSLSAPPPPLSTSLPQQSCLEEFYAMTHRFIHPATAIPSTSLLCHPTCRQLSKIWEAPQGVVKVPPLKELSEVWGIDLVSGGDCAESSFQRHSFRASTPFQTSSPTSHDSPPCEPLSLRSPSLRSSCALSLRSPSLRSSCALSLRSPSLRSSCAHPLRFDTIPDVITNLTRLIALSPSHLPVTGEHGRDLGFVSIGGTLPASMGNMPNLQKLVIGQVDSGSIPASFGNMSSLQEL